MDSSMPRHFLGKYLVNDVLFTPANVGQMFQKVVDRLAGKVGQQFGPCHRMPIFGVTSEFQVTYGTFKIFLCRGMFQWFPKTIVHM